MSETSHHSRFFWRSSAMFAILDFEIRFKEVNAAWEKTLGLSTGPLLTKSLLNFIHPEDRLSTEYYFEQLLKGGVSTAFSSRFRHQNGTYRHLLWEVTAAASQEDAFYITAMDISGRERPSVADEMVSVLEEGVVLQYANGTIGACNPSAERILGLPPDQMIGWTLIDPDWQMIKEDGTPFPTETHPAICTLRTGKAYTDSIIGVEKPDGEVLWLKVNAHPLWRDEMTPYAVVISFADVTRFKETEHSLRDHMETQAAGTPTGKGADSDFWDWNLETNRISFSVQWKRMLGYEDSELLGAAESWYQRIHPVDYKRVMADIQNHLEGITHRLENTHRLQHKDGSYRWVRCTGTTVRDASGKPVHLIGMHTDITERQQAEDQRQLSETKYQQLMDTETDGVLLVDADSDKILDVNRAATQIYGYNRQEFLRMKRAELSAQIEKPNPSNKRTTRQTRRRHHKRRDESVFPVEITTNPFVLQGKEMLILVIRDTSERQQLETALWESQSKYRQLFEASSAATIVFDANSQQIFDINNVAVSMYGYTKDEWLHLTTSDLSAEPVKSRASLYSGTRHQIIPLRWHKKKDGTVFPVEISSGSSYLFQGRSLVCATLRDITDRRAAEEALRAERDFVQTLVQNSPTFFFAVNPNGNIRMLNNAMLKALEYNLEELEGKDFIEALLPDSERTHMSDLFDSMVQSMRPQVIESQLITRSGQRLTVEWHSRAVVKPEGMLDYLFGVGIDITDREKTQSDLQLFKSIIEASDEVITISTPENQLIYVNPAYTKLFGRSLLQAQEQNRRMDYPPESHEIIEREVKPALAQGHGWSGELDILNANGKLLHVWQRADAVRDDNGLIVFKFELMHDISERKRMWETLRNQWEEYQLIFDTVPIMIWHRDHENRLLHVNKPAQLAFPNDDSRAFFSRNQEVLQSGTPAYEKQDLVLNHLGSERRLHIGRIPCTGNRGNIKGVIVYAIDMTDCAPVAGSSKPQAEDRLRKLLEQLPLLLHAVDKRGQVLAWNATAEQLTGYSNREILNNSKALQILYPDRLQQQRLRGETPTPRWQGQVLCKDGSQKVIDWLDISPQFNVSAWHNWQLGIPVGAANELAATAKLGADELPDFIFKTTQIGISITDDRGRFILINKAFATLYGYQTEELLNKPFTLVLPAAQHDDAIRDYFSLLISNEGPKLFKHSNEQRRDGKVFSLGVLTHRLLLEDGRRMLVNFCAEL